MSLKQSNNRRSSVRKNNPQTSSNRGQLDVFGGMHDPFFPMNNQIMQSFGGFGGRSLFQDDFFRNDSLMSMMSNPMDQIMNFSDMHQKAHRQGNEGSYVCQTFVSSSTMGPDGKMQKQSYYENSAGQNKNGNTISQKKQAYKDSRGLNQIAQERMLNDKGHKIVKVKRNGQKDVEQTNHYYNVEEDEARDFHNHWETKNKEIGFQDNYNKYMQKGLGYGSGSGKVHRDNPQLGLGYEDGGSNGYRNGSNSGSSNHRRVRQKQPQQQQSLGQGYGDYQPQQQFKQSRQSQLSNADTRSRYSNKDKGASSISVNSRMNGKY